jgi:hypothetical protein
MTSRKKKPKPDHLQVFMREYRLPAYKELIHTWPQAKNTAKTDHLQAISREYRLPAYKELIHTWPQAKNTAKTDHLQAISREYRLPGYKELIYTGPKCGSLAKEHPMLASMAPSSHWNRIISLDLTFLACSVSVLFLRRSCEST